VFLGADPRAVDIVDTVDIDVNVSNQCQLVFGDVCDERAM